MKPLTLLVATSALLLTTAGAFSQTKAIGPKQDDPRARVQGGRTEKLSIGPKQDDPRALKPNPNDRARGLTPNPDD